MAAVAFDTLKLARQLQDTAKMPQTQAEGVAAALAEAMSGAELATKGDINESSAALSRNITEVTGELTRNITEVTGELTRNITEVKAELTRNITEVKAELTRNITEVKAELKRDINEVKTTLTRDITEVKTELKRDIHDLELKMEGRFETVLERIDRRAAESDAKAEAYKNTLLRWLLAFAGTAFVTIIGTAAALIRYLPEALRH